MTPSRYYFMKQRPCPVVIRLLLISSCCFVFFLLTGCGGGEKFKATTTLKQFQASNREQNDKSVENHPVVLAPLTVEEEGNIGDYLLGPGDLIDIKVFEAEELNAVVRVSSSGVVNVPLLGDVSVINLTAA